VLRLMAEKNASDVYLSANTPILIKINGQILQLSTRSARAAPDAPAAGRAADAAAAGELDGHRRAQRRPAACKASAASACRRFLQRGSVAAVFRCIPHDIPRSTRWACPTLLKELVLEKRGLILMVGATGTGKSTTLASMLEWRNQQMTGHILTFEDPIEFLFTQQEVDRQPARGRPRHQSLQIGAEERAAPGARRAS
jgi:twitching motility protein PilU